MKICYTHEEHQVKTNKDVNLGDTIKFEDGEIGEVTSITDKYVWTKSYYYEGTEAYTEVYRPIRINESTKANIISGAVL